MLGSFGENQKTGRELFCSFCTAFRFFGLVWFPWELCVCMCVRVMHECVSEKKKGQGKHELPRAINCLSVQSPRRSGGILGSPDI